MTIWHLLLLLLPSQEAHIQHVNGKISILLSTTLKIVFSVTVSICLLNTNCKRLCNVTNTKCKPNIICHSFEANLGMLQCCKYCHLLSDFSFEILIIHDNVHYIDVRMQNIPKVDELRINWDENIYKLIYWKSYHGDLKYHITLNIIYSVVVQLNAPYAIKIKLNYQLYLT